MIYLIGQFTPNQEKWIKHYHKLIDNALSRTNEGYVEKHHIIPKCMGGTNKKDNLVDLTAREHYVAHQLLAKIYPFNIKLIKACHIMCVDRYGTRLTNREFEWIRKKYAESVSRSFKGKNKTNDERCKKISQSLTGRTKESHPYLADIGQKVSKALKGQTKETHERPLKVSKALTGRTKETDPSLEKRSQLLKGRTKETHEGPKKISEALTGRTKETHDYLFKMSEKKKGQTLENNESVRKGAEKRRGKNKTNCDYVKIISEKLSILTIKDMELIDQLKKDNLNMKQILTILNSQGINIAYSTLCANYKRFINNTFL
jgi:hypothetical protein